MNKSLRVVDWRTSRYIRDAKRLMTNDTHVHNTHTHTQLFFSPSCRGVWRWLNKFKRWGRTPVCRRPKRWRNKQLLPAFACVGAAELSHTGTTRKINKKKMKIVFFFRRVSNNGGTSTNPRRSWIPTGIRKSLSRPLHHGRLLHRPQPYLPPPPTASRRLSHAVLFTGAVLSLCCSAAE